MLRKEERLKSRIVPKMGAAISRLYWLLLPSRLSPLTGVPMRSFLLLPLVSLVLLSGCDRLGMPDPVAEAARRDADARATGSACRHAGRGIEDCYAQNPDASRAPVYAGWKEMNDYMRENNIAEVKPADSAAASAASAASAKEAAAEEQSSASADSASAKKGKKSR